MKASGSSMARREEDGEVGEASGSQGRKLGSLYDVEMVLRVRLRAEVDGGGRVHRRGALGGNGEEGVDAARESGNGVAVLHALLGGRA